MSITTKANLKDVLKNLSYDHLREEFYTDSFYKGLKYHDHKHVGNVRFTGSDSLEAEVYGTGKYRVTLKLENQEIQQHCSCPVGGGGGCKHVVAVMLYCLNNESIYDQPIQNDDESDRDVVEEHLHSLSREELINLVIKFAPENFHEFITFNNYDFGQAKKLLQQVASQLESLYEDEEDINYPASFEDSLNSILEKLKGIWEKLPDETGELFLSTLKNIQSLIDEGYLYDHQYDDVLDTGQLDKLIREYITSLPTMRKLTFINQIEELGTEFESYLCDGILHDRQKLFDERDIPELKEFVLQESANLISGSPEAYYTILSEHLTDEEREKVLLSTFETSDMLTLELAKVYRLKNRFDDAIKTLEVYLQNSEKNFRLAEPHYIELLTLKKEMGYPLKSTSLEALEQHPSETLLEVVTEYLPENRTSFEKIVRKRNINKFIKYLENHGRIDEAVKLVMSDRRIWDNDKFKFFIQHLNDCPEEAKTYFCHRINGELDYTGDNHYYAIADTLQALKSIDPTTAIALAEEIRIEYKRRPNLMKAIRGI